MMFRNENGLPSTWSGMPNFEIHVVNSDFDACDEIEANDFEEAARQGLRAALLIGVDELCTGKTPFFGAEIRVESGGEVKQRFMVGMGQSPLKSA
jgi:hypothetical protein